MIQNFKRVRFRAVGDAIVFAAVNGPLVTGSVCFDTGKYIEKNI